MDLFVVKHYRVDDRPSLKGNGFDGLEIGETRDEAEDFIHWVNLRVRENEVFRAERDHARAQFDNAARLLTGIHALLYPPQLILQDGRTLAFRPTNPDPHEVLQALSDRIRALPDELEKLRAASATQPADGAAVEL